MKIRKADRPWVLTALLLASPAVLNAQESGPARRVRLEEPPAPSKDRFGLSYRATFNVSAEFKNVGVTPPGSGARGPGNAGGGVDHFYDDGYVRVDSTHSGGGLTWFWGYKNASQVGPDDTLAMHSSSVLPISSQAGGDEVQPGFELAYNRELGRSEPRGWSWGLEGAFGWTDIDIEDHRTLSGGLRQTTDAYNIGGYDPHQPPYSVEYPGHAGTYEGPGPLIDATPHRSVAFTSAGATVTGLRSFAADLFTLRLGPYFEIPIHERWVFSFSAGGALGLVDGQFRFAQQVSTPTGRSSQIGSAGSVDVIFGGFVNGTLRYAIDKNWGVSVSGQCLGLTSYEAQALGQQVEVGFAATVSGSLGLSYSF